MGTNRIVGEPYFKDRPKNSYLLEHKFVPLDQSVIWNCNELFWKYYDIWKNTYGEEYETAIPSGKSLSHSYDFIQKSACRFFNYLLFLQKNENLPNQIYVFEQGAGNGVYAYTFLNFIKRWSNDGYPFYQNLTYVISDYSAQILNICREKLLLHKNNVEFFLQPTFSHVPNQLKGKVLLCRHSNMWDQLPARLFHKEGATVSEIYTRAFVSSEFSNYRNLEGLIKEKPQIWKPFILSIGLETEKVPISPRRQKGHPYNLLNDGYSAFSEGILQNLSALESAVDWNRDGYIEIVDIMTSNQKQLGKLRGPKKFDGSTAITVTGHILEKYMMKKGKKTIFEPVKYLNTVVSFRNPSFKSLLQSGKFLTVAEIAARKDDSKELLLKKTKDLFLAGVDTVTFSDMAHGWSEFQSVQQLLGLKLFSEFEKGSILQVFATRRKRKDEINEYIAAFKKQNIQNLLVVTGDESDFSDSGLKSYDLLPVLSKHFFTGAVAKPNINEIDYLEDKIKKGAQFIITQSTYDFDAFKKWEKEVLIRKLHEKCFFIASIIPIVTKKTIEAIQAFTDVPVPNAIIDRFNALSDEEIRKAGINLSAQMIENIKRDEIFSGVYIFSRSTKVVQELISYSTI